ncbi:hypothetical protein [Mycobacterium vicinigordonae]|uniref:Uncharacterized protein n=1 Tax=Mycobacterium vicinigordonae TaxID=1719132 RepID=A0A7D6IU89_9MYCO|nr:hypothetical protein [Mycobacterium vicinigordonae]QLL08999.1 hypothetical protein H0P51_08960 [Mycobacterium vicinigordonae]
MPYDEGVSDWRLYSAEQSVGHDRVLTIEECEALVDEAVASEWFKDWFPDTPPIRVVLGGGDWSEQNAGYSFAQASGQGYVVRAIEWVISMHPRMLSARVLLHELAHCVQPVYIAEELTQYSDFPLEYARRKHRKHGAFFAATMSVITDNMLPGDEGQLADAYDFFEAPCATYDELREQLVAQPEIIDAQEAMYDEMVRESRERDEEYRTEFGKCPEIRIPQIPWGWTLLDLRRQYHRRAGGRLVSQERLAEEIRKVTPCTTRQIRAIEQARKRPDDPALLKIAMLITIYVGLDPIWTRYNMLLTRWGCGSITLKEARLLNPGWAKLVSKMNKQLRERPPRWKVAGDR